MALIVQKYGGTSMGSTERIKSVAARVAKWHKAGNQVIVVTSAMSGETNRLLGLAREVSDQPDPRELDMLVSTGEQTSVTLLAMALKLIGEKAVSYAGWQLPVNTDSAYTKARISSVDDVKIKRELDDGKIVIVTGFQGIDKLGNVTTLGRGGSDTSAVAVAAALKASECMIYTDVDGVYTTDPRVVPDARRLETVHIEEMLEMSSLGSKVLQIRSVEFASNCEMPIRVLSSLTDPLMPLEEEGNSGTLVSFEKEINMEQTAVTGIAFNREEAKITVMGIPYCPDIAHQILEIVSDENIEVDMITQSRSKDGKNDFTFTVLRDDYNKVKNILDNKKESIDVDEITSDSGVSKVSVIGVGMRSHVGVASQMLRTLSEEEINVHMISTSEIKISALIDEEYIEQAVRALHNAFGLQKA
jgi:aspartate kinase